MRSMCLARMWKRAQLRPPSVPGLRPHCLLGAAVLAPVNLPRITLRPLTTLTQLRGSLCPPAFTGCSLPPHAARPLSTSAAGAASTEPAPTSTSTVSPTGPERRRKKMRSGRRWRPAPKRANAYPAKRKVRVEVSELEAIQGVSELVSQQHPLLLKDGDVMQRLQVLWPQRKAGVVRQPVDASDCTRYTQAQCMDHTRMLVMALLTLPLQVVPHILGIAQHAQTRLDMFFSGAHLATITQDHLPDPTRVRAQLGRAVRHVLSPYRTDQDVRSIEVAHIAKFMVLLVEFIDVTQIQKLLQDLLAPRRQCLATRLNQHLSHADLRTLRRTLEDQQNGDFLATTSARRVLRRVMTMCMEACGLDIETALTKQSKKQPKKQSKKTEAIVDEAEDAEYAGYAAPGAPLLWVDEAVPPSVAGLQLTRHTTSRMRASFPFHRVLPNVQLQELDLVLFLTPSDLGHGAAASLESHVPGLCQAVVEALKGDKEAFEVALGGVQSMQELLAVDVRQNHVLSTTLAMNADDASGVQTLPDPADETLPTASGSTTWKRADTSVPSDMLEARVAHHILPRSLAAERKSPGRVGVQAIRHAIRQAIIRGLRDKLKDTKGDSKAATRRLRQKEVLAVTKTQQLDRKWDMMLERAVLLLTPTALLEEWSKQNSHSTLEKSATERHNEVRRFVNMAQGHIDPVGQVLCAVRLGSYYSTPTQTVAKRDRFLDFINREVLVCDWQRELLMPGFRELSDSITPEFWLQSVNRHPSHGHYAYAAAFRNESRERAYTPLHQQRLAEVGDFDAPATDQLARLHSPQQSGKSNSAVRKYRRQRAVSQAWTYNCFDMTVNYAQAVSHIEEFDVNRAVRVTNLHGSVTVSDLQTAFGPCGSLLGIEVYKDLLRRDIMFRLETYKKRAHLSQSVKNFEKTLPPLGFAFLYFADDEGVARALSPALRAFGVSIHGTPCFTYPLEMSQKLVIANMAPYLTPSRIKMLLLDFLLDKLLGTEHQVTDVRVFAPLDIDNPRKRQLGKASSAYVKLSFNSHVAARTARKYLLTPEAVQFFGSSFRVSWGFGRRAPFSEAAFTELPTTDQPLRSGAEMDPTSDQQLQMAAGLPHRAHGSLNNANYSYVNGDHSGDDVDMYDIETSRRVASEEMRRASARSVRPDADADEDKFTLDDMDEDEIHPFW